MRAVLVSGSVAATVAAVAAGLIFGLGRAADPVPPPRPVAGPAAAAPAPFVVHEWGTFTSFAGSDGVPVPFHPNNTDLPRFIYFQENLGSKGSFRFGTAGTVSMETPVIYFYTDHPMQASVRVDFPLGWITEWYPYAATAPTHGKEEPFARGQSMRWQVQLLPGESPAFPREQNANPYYEARSTDAAAVQTEVTLPEDERAVIRGGKVVQHEKFLFYRGVGTFPTPVTVHALGGGKVRVANATPDRVGGVVLVRVQGGRVGFRVLDDLDGKREVMTTLPEMDGRNADLAEALVGKLTAAGLYEKEARAMVKTWESAWFGEEGTRLLYLVPRTRTDELLPLAIEPKPTTLVRVLVGRHDFLTPEQEESADRQVRRVRVAQAELAAAEKELQQIGRFGPEARRLAEGRLVKEAGAK